MVLFAAGTNQQALDQLGPGDRSPNGLFTRVLLKQMAQPGVSVDRVLRGVRDEVVRLAKSVGHEQVPALYDQAIGDFYFRPATGNSTAVATVQPVDTAATELAFWDTIKSSTDAEDFQAYLDKYPGGQFVTLAERRVKRKATKSNEPAASVSIPISNFSFENPSLRYGGFTFDAAGWTVTREAGAFHPNKSHLPQGATDGIQTGWANYGKLSQSLPAVLAANTHYVLTVDLLHRIDEPSSSSTVELLAGGKVLASSTIKGGARGTNAVQTVNFIAGAAEPYMGQPLGINLISDGVQANWDNVRLLSTKVSGSVPD
jgi:hypothetical protein